MFPGPRLGAAYDEGAVFPALVTDHVQDAVGVWRHAWTELAMNQDGTLALVWPARSGTLVRGFAYALNNQTVLPPQQVWMRVRGEVGGEVRYEFVPGLVNGGLIPLTGSPPTPGGPPFGFDPIPGVGAGIGFDPVTGLLWIVYGGEMWAFCDPCIHIRPGSGSGSGAGGDGSGGVATGCCVSVPTTLYAVVSGGPCAGTYTIKHQDPGEVWSTEFPGSTFGGWGSCSAQMVLQCEGPAPYHWTFSPDGGGHVYAPTLDTCAPFHLRFVVGDDPCGCGPCTIDVLP